MDYSQLVIDTYWETMTGFTPLIVPFIACILVVRLIASLILDKR